MARIFILFLVLPWWAYFILAGAVGYFGEQIYQSDLKKEAALVAAYEAPAPAVVDLSDFRRDRDGTPVNEVTISGWINPDYNAHLIETTNGIETGSRYMHVLFGRDDDASAGIARAAIVFSSEAQKDQFHAGEHSYLDMPRSLARDDAQVVYTMNGFGKNSHSVRSHAVEVITGYGLTLSDDFIFITPFFDGREVALMPQGVPHSTRLNGWLLAAAMALFGVIKVFLRRRKAKPVTTKNDPFADGPIAGVQTTPTPAPVSAALPSNIAADSPLGRIARQQAAQVAAVAAASHQPALVSPKRHLPKIQRLSPKMLPLLIAALVALGLLYLNLLSYILPIAMIAGFWGLVYLVKRGARSLVSDLKRGKSASEDPYERLYRHTHPAE